MKTVEFTLYEILGYIFPGAVTMLGIYLLLWKFMLVPEQNWDIMSGWGWTALLAIAYVFGHSVQAVTNLITRFVKPPSLRSQFSDELWSTVKARAKESVGVSPAASLSNEDDRVFDIADHVLMQRGKTEMRDIYIYREGFYRGMTFALFVLACGCLVHILHSGIRLTAFGLALNLARSALVSIGIAVLMMAYLYFNRYLRFLQYHRNYVIYSFLAISAKPPVGAAA
jgi:hypothetical protein